MHPNQNRYGELGRLVTKYLISTLGEEGLQTATDKLHSSMPSTDLLLNADLDAKLSCLDSVISNADRYDLRGKDVRLRGMGNIGVLAQLLRVVLEAFGSGVLDPMTYLEVIVDELKTRHDQGIESIKQTVRAALSEYLIEAGHFDRAQENIRLSLQMHSACPYSQRLLYLALLGRKSQGKSDNLEGAHLDDLSDRFCSQPFTTLATGQMVRGGSTKPLTFGCQCIGMLPYPLSDPNKPTDTREEIWNGPEIQEIRRSILDGDFTYCSRSVCNLIVGNQLPKKNEVNDPIMEDIIANNRVALETPPRMISLAHDTSCNLACPSCRSEVVAVQNETRNVYDTWIAEVVLPLLTDAKTTLIVAGDGDPFASRHYRKLIHSLDPTKHSGVELWLITNGLLFTRTEWDSLGPIQKLIKVISVSIDAAQKETYEDLRRPGKWERIVSNMEFLGQLRKQGKIYDLTINFVVQAKNYKQMPQMVALGQSWNVSRVRFLRLINILSYTSEQFQANDIVDQSHPMHAHFRELLDLPIMRTAEVDLFNIPRKQFEETEAPAHLGTDNSDHLHIQVASLCAEVDKWRGKARASKEKCNLLQKKIKSLRLERRERERNRPLYHLHQWWRTVRLAGTKPMDRNERGTD